MRAGLGGGDRRRGGLIAAHLEEGLHHQVAPAPPRSRPCVTTPGARQQRERAVTELKVATKMARRGVGQGMGSGLVKVVSPECLLLDVAGHQLVPKLLRIP